MRFADAAAPRQALPGEINGDALDRFTFAHLGFGAACGWLRVPWWATMGLAIGWEIAEDRLKTKYPAVFPSATYDTPANAIADVLAAGVGYLLTRR
jgi:hypothetical protein